MTVISCARAWQAEAVFDDRLAAADAESFRRHATTCTTCARELELLARLSAAGAELSWPESTPLARRRLRQELLREANERALGGSRASAWLHVPRKPWAAFALLSCAALALLIGWPHDEPQSKRAARLGSPSFRLQSSENAVWRTLERGAQLRLAAERGHFELTVDALRAGQRFVVTLPDGELEVQGTRFAFDVDGTHTERVEVQEGRVALRLATSATRVLSAGDSWTNWAKTKIVTAEPAANSELDASATSAAASSPAPAPAPRAARGRESAGAAFARGMGAFKRAEYERAEHAFRAFTRAHPLDARVEDALFLRALAAARRGDAAASRALAQEYLARYPNGLRRSEVERMAR